MDQTSLSELIEPPTKPLIKIIMVQTQLLRSKNVGKQTEYLNDDSKSTTTRSYFLCCNWPKKKTPVLTLTCNFKDLYKSF